MLSKQVIIWFVQDSLAWHLAHLFSAYARPSCGLLCNVQLCCIDGNECSKSGLCPVMLDLFFEFYLTYLAFDFMSLMCLKYSKSLRLAHSFIQVCPIDSLIVMLKPMFYMLSVVKVSSRFTCMHVLNHSWVMGLFIRPWNTYHYAYLHFLSLLCIIHKLTPLLCGMDSPSCVQLLLCLGESTPLVGHFGWGCQGSAAAALTQAGRIWHTSKFQADRDSLAAYNSPALCSLILGD